MRSPWFILLIFFSVKSFWANCSFVCVSYMSSSSCAWPLFASHSYFTHNNSLLYIPNFFWNSALNVFSSMDFVSKSPIACGRAASLAFRLPWTRLLSLSSHRGPVASWKIWLSWYLPHTFHGQLDFSWISYFYWKIWILVLVTLKFIVCVVIWSILEVRCPWLPCLSTPDKVYVMACDAWFRTLACVFVVL